MILPLFLLSSIILYMIYDAGQKEQFYEYENISNSIRYDFEYTFEDAVNQMNDVYMDSAVNDFLNRKYENPYDYFEANVALDGRSSLNRLDGTTLSESALSGKYRIW